MNFSIDVEYSKCPDCEKITLNFIKNIPIACDDCQEKKLTHSIGDLVFRITENNEFWNIDGNWIL